MRITVKNYLTGCFITLFIITTSAAPTFADDLKAQKDKNIEYVTVIGSKKAAFDEAGSADYISSEDLEEFLHTDVLRVLRQAPGLYVQEEEGFGLRPNIGIRGSGSDRSSRISILEDGVLIAPAPYSAPSAYYFPSQLRMSAVEVLKGPSAIRVGARTVGGAINFVSTPIPEDVQGEITALYGTDATNQLVAHYGGKANNFGYLAEFSNYGSDGFKTIPNTKKNADGFDLQDYLTKFSYDLETANGGTNYFELKLSKTEQDADSSYLGLTKEDFFATPYQRYAASALDNIKTSHEQVQLNYIYTPQDAEWQFGLTAYKNNFSRNWYKLHTTTGGGLTEILENPSTFATAFGWLNGSIDSPDDALQIRANKRDYVSQGVQLELLTETYVGETAILWNIGARSHRDEEDRFQDQDGYRMQNGQLILTNDAAPGTTTNRVSDAKTSSAYIDADIELGKWSVKPGVRYENIDLTRKDFSTINTDRSIGPIRSRSNTVNVFIPGFGVTYKANDALLLLAGFHHGFNPPAPGSTSEEEESKNLEFGFRYDNGNLLAEVIAFYNDYDNIVGTFTASTGGTGNIGDQFDGGQATVSGLEVDLQRVYNLENGLSMPLKFVHTWTSSFEFDNDFDSAFEPWGNVVAGDELPYIPEHQFQVSAGLQANKWSTQLQGNYTGERRTRAGQDNTNLLDAYFVLDLSADYYLSDDIRLFSRIENLLDKKYVAAARPSGFRPGKSRAVLLGVNYKF